MVDPDEIAEVRVAVPDPEVEARRAGEIPDWMLERLELFVKASRLDPENLARVLGRVEG